MTIYIFNVVFFYNFFLSHDLACLIKIELAKTFD